MEHRTGSESVKYVNVRCVKDSIFGSLFFFFDLLEFCVSCLCSNRYIVRIYLNLMVNNLNNIKMEKEMLLLYEAPVVEIIEVEVEKGFAASLTEGNAPVLEGGYQGNNW